MCELLHKLSNDLKRLGNFKKISEMLGFDGEYPADQRQILTFVLKNREKSALKNSIEKHVLLNFMDLSTIFCP